MSRFIKSFNKLNICKMFLCVKLYMVCIHIFRGETESGSAVWSYFSRKHAFYYVSNIQNTKMKI